MGLHVHSHLNIVPSTKVDGQPSGVSPIMRAELATSARTKDSITGKKVRRIHHSTGKCEDSIQVIANLRKAFIERPTNYGGTTDEKS